MDPRLEGAIFVAGESGSLLILRRGSGAMHEVLYFKKPELSADGEILNRPDTIKRFRDYGKARFCYDDLLCGLLIRAQKRQQAMEFAMKMAESGNPRAKARLSEVAKLKIDKAPRYPPSITWPKIPAEGRILQGPWKKPKRPL